MPQKAKELSALAVSKSLIWCRVRLGGSPAYPSAVFSKNSFHYTDFGDKINFCVSQADSEPKS